MYAKLMTVTCECDRVMYLEYHYTDGRRFEWFVCPNPGCEFYDQKFSVPRIPLAPYQEARNGEEGEDAEG